MLTKNKGSANSGLSVEELKKQASKAAVAKAVEVIKDGGTQAEAAVQARAVAREVLEKGTKEMQLAADKKKKKGGGLMSRFRRNKSKSKNSTASAADESKTTQGTKGTDSKNSKPSTVDDADESGSTMSNYSSRSDSGGSSRSGYTTDEYSNLSKPSVYVDNGYSQEESVSLITGDRTYRSENTINVMDLINMKNVMAAIDNAVEEQDAKEEFKSGQKDWIDSILDCDICFVKGEDDSSASATKSNASDVWSKASDVWSKVSLKSSKTINTLKSKANNSQVAQQPMPPIEETVMENENVDAPVENENVDAPAVNPPAAMAEKGSVGNTPQGSALKKKASEDGAGVVKPGVSWADDSLVSAGAGPSMDQTLTHTSPPAVVENVPKSPVTAGSATNKLSSSNSIKSTSSLKKRLLGKKSGKQSPQPEQVLDQRQDSNLDWRSKVTDEAPQPNPRQLARQQQVYDPQRSNPSVFIPRRSEPSQGEFINTGEMKQHPVPQMNVQPGYGYPQYPHGSVPAAAIPQNQQYYGYPPPPPSSPYGNPPSSPYGSNPSSPRVAQPGSQQPSIVTGNNSSLSDADEDSGNDRYGGDEADMISDAVAKSKSQVDAAYGVLPAAPHGMMQHQHAQHYPPPQQYPPQQHYPQNYPPQQQQQQQYPPAPPQQQYQYSSASPQQQYQYSPAPPQPQQQYPHPQIDPNPSTAAYYEQHGSPAAVSMIPGRQQFAA